jgi:hypothetical protein
LSIAVNIKWTALSPRSQPSLNVKSTHTPKRPTSYCFYYFLASILALL